MRVIVTFFGPYAPDALTSHVSGFSHNFKRFERLTKLATSSLEGVAAGRRPTLLFVRVFLYCQRKRGTYSVITSSRKMLCTPNTRQAWARRCTTSPSVAQGAMHLSRARRATVARVRRGVLLEERQDE